ncbi:MAG: methyltransferase domain-containing protein, partial [Alcanivoracaceae bacterium]|nr:methyltransferase domain-containing protein [Alcanivoracaceae bacterium]
MTMRSLRQWASLLRATPLHPQWLLPHQTVPCSAKQLTGRVLDIGAADRWLQRHLTECQQYVALDYPATGQELYGARPDVFADGAKLPFPDQCFDGVFCLEVLEHVPEPAKVMQEISRVLKPGGRAWISMPFLYPLHDAPFDFQRYTEYGLRRDAKKAGLRVEQLQGTGHALRTAGLLGCLAIAGGVMQAGGWRMAL